jgi:hypothetical protein
MTIKEVETYKKELCEIQKIALNKEKWEKLKALAIKLNTPIPAGLHDDFTIDSINKLTHNIHNSLQTEMMLIACTSSEQSSTTAKRACTWAAVAAIASAIGAIVALLAIFIELYL